MATAKTNNKVTAGEIISATQRFSNIGDPDRKYDISADVNFDNGKVQNFNTGVVKPVGEEGMKQASFNASASLSYFNFSTNSVEAADIKDYLDAALNFMAEVKSIETA